MPSKRKIGVLTRNEIVSENVITAETIDRKSIKPASYDLRLGNEYYVPNDPVTASIASNIRKCSDSNEVLSLKPYSSIVFSTEEILSLPGHIIGRFDMRIAFAMQGLVLQVGPQVEPNYKGRLFGLLLNFSDGEILIPRYTRLLSIEFNYLYDSVIPAENNNRIYNSLADFLKNKPHVKGTLEAFLTKINDTYQNTLHVQERIQNTLQDLETEKRKKSNFYWTIILSLCAIALAIMIPFLSVYITKQTIDKDDYPFERIINLEREKDSLKKTNEKLNEELLFINSKVDSLHELYKEQLKPFFGKKLKNGKL